MLGNTESGRRRGQQRIRWLDGITITRWAWVWVNSGRWWWTGRPGVWQSVGSQRVRHDWATELNWTECSARDNLTLSVHNSISFSPVSGCHFTSFLEFTTNNILHYISWPCQRRDYSGSFFSHSLFTGFMECVLCVSAVDPWMFSGLTLSCWLHTEITLKSRLFNWTQKSSNWF